MTAPGAWLASIATLVAEQAGVTPAEVDRDTTLGELGLGSAATASLTVRLGELVGRTLPLSTCYDHPTVRRLAVHLGGPVASATAADPEDALHPAASPAAVVGMACRLPGANDLEEYWELLCIGGDAVRDDGPPDPRRRGRGLGPGGYLDNVDAFDCGAFGVSPAEAAEMDPQQRVLLHVVAEACQHAGLRPADLAGSETGVFVGASHTEDGVEEMAGRRGVGPIRGWHGNGRARPCAWPRCRPARR